MGIVIKVGNSVNGAILSVNLASKDLVVDEMRDELVKLSGIPVDDQILLCGPRFIRLDYRRAIESYDLPSDDKKIYLYDRRMLLETTPSPTQAPLVPKLANLPSTPASSSESSRLLSESTNPLLRALADYESHFQLQVAQAQVLERASNENFKAATDVLGQLEIQSQSIQAARINLNMFKTDMNKRFGAFFEESKKTAAMHDELLKHFEEYLDKLRTITLHSALQTDTRKTLLDCIPVEREREWAAQCGQSHGRMSQQVAQLKAIHDEVVLEVEDLMEKQEQATNTILDVARLEVENMNQKVLGQQRILATVQENLQTVIAKVAETSAESSNQTTTGAPRNMMMASTMALEVCRGIDVLYNQQHNMIPTAQDAANSVVQSVNAIEKVRVELFQTVHGQLLAISHAQSKIRDFEHSLKMLIEAHSSQKKNFEELGHLQKLPESYDACLKEIARRRRYGKSFSERIQEMAEELAQKRESEVDSRELFLRQFGHHMPRDFVKGLAEKPSHCEFRMRPFDQSLPEIDDILVDERSGKVSVGNPSSIDAQHNGTENLTEGNQVTPPFDLSNIAGQSVQTQIEYLEAQLLQLKLNVNGGENSRSDLGSAVSRSDDEGEFPLELALATVVMQDTPSNSVPKLGRDELKQINEMEAALKESQNEIQALSRTLSQLKAEKAHLVVNIATLEQELEQNKHVNETLRNRADLGEAELNEQKTALHTIEQLLKLGDNEASNDVIRTERICEQLKNLIADHAHQPAQQARESDDEGVMVAPVEEIDRISFRSFDVGDLALFLPIMLPGATCRFLAFHVRCPNRFLSDESIASLSTSNTRPDYILGRIVFIDEHVASESHNPYGLATGTTFYVLTVANIH